MVENEKERISLLLYSNNLGNSITCDISDQWIWNSISGHTIKEH